MRNLLIEIIRLRDHRATLTRPTNQIHRDPVRRSRLHPSREWDLFRWQLESQSSRSDVSEEIRNALRPKRFYMARGPRISRRSPQKRANPLLRCDQSAARAIEITRSICEIRTSSDGSPYPPADARPRPPPTAPPRLTSQTRGRSIEYRSRPAEDFPPHMTRS